MTPRMARVKIIADDNAPVRLRIQALKEVNRPPLAMLRRLIADTAKRTKPVPPRLKALALMRYAHEAEKRKIKTGAPKKSTAIPNALGIE